LIICVVIDTPLALPRGPRGPFCPGDTQADETLTVFPSGAVRTLDKSTWAASTVRRCPAQKYLNPIQPKTQSAGSCFSFHEPVRFCTWALSFVFSFCGCGRQ
jgi:hypothetical protein